MPSLASSLATAPIKASVFRLGSRKSILSMRTSGIALLKICTCLTWPAMIAELTDPDPGYPIGDFLYGRIGLFANRGDRDLSPGAVCAVDNEKRKLSVA